MSSFSTSGDCTPVLILKAQFTFDRQPKHKGYLGSLATKNILQRHSKEMPLQNVLDTGGKDLLFSFFLSSFVLPVLTIYKLTAVFTDD